MLTIERTSIVDLSEGFVAPLPLQPPAPPPVHPVPPTGGAESGLKCPAQCSLLLGVHGITGPQHRTACPSLVPAALHISHCKIDHVTRMGFAIAEGEVVESRATLCGNGVCDAKEDCSTCPQDCVRDDGRPCQRIGMLYAVWHWCAFPSTYMMASMEQEESSVVRIQLRSETAGAAKLGTRTTCIISTLGFNVVVRRPGADVTAPHPSARRPAWNAVQLTLKMGKPFLSVEDVLRSRTHTANGSTSGASFRDIVFGNGLAGESMLFHWQVRGQGCDRENGVFHGACAGM